MNTTSMLCEEGTFALGTYYPRNHREHHVSPFSRAVLKVKRCCQHEIEMFGHSIGQFLDVWLPANEPYIITHVPAEPSVVQYLFPEVGACPARQLAVAIHRQIQGNKWVTVEKLLTVARLKTKKQRQCHGVRERYHNVEGCYKLEKGVDVSGINTVIVDDVVTSGATMGECKKVLEKAGAKSVTGIALARTVHKRWWPY